MKRVRWLVAGVLSALLFSSVVVAGGWKGFAARTVRVDGVPLAGDTPAIVVEGKVFVPVEAVAALFAATVKPGQDADAIDIFSPSGLGPWDRATAMLPGDTLANAYLSVQFKNAPGAQDLWALALAMKSGLRRYDGIHVLSPTGTITIHGSDIVDWTAGRITDQQFVDKWAFPAAAPARLPAATTPALAVPVTGVTYFGTGMKHWISRTMDAGQYVKLEDGSLWEISPLDRIDTMLWLIVDNIVVKESGNPLYPYLLINTNDDETAEAKLISR